MIERILLPVVIMAATLLPTASPAADRRDAITAAVDRAFRPLLAEYDVPGLAVAVTVGGQRHVFCYGLASKNGAVPVTKDTIFEIGSLSKTFTATLVADAEGRGDLSLADHPGKYMPELRGSAIDAASLMNLGTYTAGGLPLQAPDPIATDADMTAYLRTWKGWAPGTKRLYSNVSIGLLGHITALAMRLPFAELMQSELFPRLGLRHSYIKVPEREMAHYAWGTKDGRPTRVSPGVFDSQAYGVKSTAADMIAFVEDNIHPGALAPPVRRGVEGTHVGYFKVGEMVQGLGWEQYPYPVALDRLLAGNSGAMSMQANAVAPLQPPRSPSEPTFFDKTGSTNGFGAYAAFVPQKGIGIVMLANKNLPIPARITAAYVVLEKLADLGEHPAER